MTLISNQFSFDSMLSSFLILNITLPIDASSPWIELAKGGSFVALLGYLNYVQRNDLQQMKKEMEATIIAQKKQHDDIVKEKDNKIVELYEIIISELKSRNL